MTLVCCQVSWDWRMFKSVAYGIFSHSILETAAWNSHSVILLEKLKQYIIFSEFSSQLPHDGGAFYSNESVESVRPYYQAAWPPMLHAAALWLSAGGFDKAEQEQTGGRLTPVVMATSSNSTTAAAKMPQDLNTDRFYLLLGWSCCLIWKCIYRLLQYWPFRLHLKVLWKYWLWFLQLKILWKMTRYEWTTVVISDILFNIFF